MRVNFTYHLCDGIELDVEAEVDPGQPSSPLPAIPETTRKSKTWSSRLLRSRWIRVVSSPIPSPAPD